MLNKKVIAFDLDDVLCFRDCEDGKVDKYKACKPIQKMIDIVNQCYDKGHTIIIYTARGSHGFCGNIYEIYSNLYSSFLNIFY